MKNRYLFIWLVLSSCYLEEGIPPDQDIWTYALPSENGLLDSRLLEINGLIAGEGYQAINGLIIIKNDKLIFENYYYSNNRATIQNIGKGGLSFTLAAIGVALDKRLLTLDDPISSYLSSYADIFQSDILKQDITIRHLMSYSSGIAWNESIQPFSITNDLTLMKSSNDWVRFVLEQPMEAPAGIRTNINTGSGVLLAKIVEEASGQHFDEFLEENILNPLGITSLTIEKDDTGNFNGGDGISLSLIDWTKFGYLHLNEGVWKGRKVLDANFVLEATSPLNQPSSTLSFGYFWQIFGSDLSTYFGIPHNSFYYIPGDLGQHLYIIPTEKMIVAIFAENYISGIVNPSVNLFRDITNSFQ